MKNSLTLLVLFSCVWTTLIWTTSCDNDQLAAPEPTEFCDTLMATYNTVIQPIIESSCSYDGCHDGAGGIGPGNYTTYKGLEGILDGGQFMARVINQKNDPSSGMPPDASVYPQSKKEDLTPEELEIVQCWLNAGYPEN